MGKESTGMRSLTNVAAVDEIAANVGETGCMVLGARRPGLETGCGCGEGEGGVAARVQRDCLPRG